jgi:hypothetical protein
VRGHLDPPCGPVWDRGCASNRPPRGWRPTLRPIRSPRGPAQTSACRSARGFPVAPHWGLRERTTRWGRIFVRWMRVTAAISTAPAGNKSTRHHEGVGERAGREGPDETWEGWMYRVSRRKNWPRSRSGWEGFRGRGWVRRVSSPRIPQRDGGVGHGCRVGSIRSYYGSIGG